jgi:hypothetical protein
MSNLVNVRDHIDQVVDLDWAPAFAAAIGEAVTGGRSGVFVPADAVDYTVRKPGRRMPSIDLRNRTNFTLAGDGDGSRIRMLGSGLGGSWNMIMIGGDCVDITVRDLYLDGDSQNLTELDPGQHTHTIQIGGMVTGGSAHRIRVLGCTMTDMDGDGVALAALAGAFGAGDDVAVVDIIGCKFLNCRRSGVSNQRSSELVRIHGCHFEDTSDQDIDFEPTGAELGSGPRRYSIVGNTMIHRTDATAVTLSGVGGDIPAIDNIFALNHVYGGSIGMVDTRHVLIFGNYIASGLNDNQAVLSLRGTSRGARISHNHIVRVEGAVPGRTLNIESRAREYFFESVDITNDAIGAQSHGRVSGTGPAFLTTTGTLPTGLALSTDYWLIRVDANTLKLATSKATALEGAAVALSDSGTGRHRLVVVDHPNGVDINHNQLHSHTSPTPGPDPDGKFCTVRVTNGQECSFTDNEVWSLAGAAVETGVRFETSAAVRITIDDWNISHNRIRGDAGNGGTYADGILIRPVGVPVAGVRLNGNSFRGCTSQIRWAGNDSLYADIPTALGNVGDGVDFVDLDHVRALCIGGSTQSQADYVYDANGDPSFAAADGSTARRRNGGGNGSTIYFREAGTWTGK